LAVAAKPIAPKQAEQAKPEDLFHELGSSAQGLTDDEAGKRLQQVGPNTLEEKKRSALRKFLGYFWGPIPWMIEVAAILSAILQHWLDLVIIFALLLINAIIGFWEEHKADTALEALKGQLALKARVRRSGQWREIAAAQLVPGDVVRLRLGDVVPADAKLFDGDYLSVDQSALTGESLPVSKKKGDLAYSGSIAKQGEMAALVTATGKDTFFGRTAGLVESAGAPSHFQQAVLRVGRFLIVIAIGLSILLVVVELLRHLPFLQLIQFVLIVVIASIPVAMPAVLSVTMALGAMALSKRKAIVSHLQAIEEMAGINILCSDKTGTLTQNKLTAQKPVLYAAKDPKEIFLVGSLASKAEDQDVIDKAVMAGLGDDKLLQSYKQTKFVPFDPVKKRTEATITDSGGKTFRVAKGAPQVILKLCKLDQQTLARANKDIEEMAGKGYRTLGVARTENGDNWRFLGILPLEDPPREDSADTIRRAQEHGVDVKMVTGDNTAIARQIARQLNLGTNIHSAEEFFGDSAGKAPQTVKPTKEKKPSAASQDGDSEVRISPEVAAEVEKADGFAQVFPEHKYAIVKALQARDFLVGMTGDGVNDAPALKQADVGIAVSGATEAARSAADLVLTKPGLSVIINAIEEARRIFERMMSYTIYRIAMTIDIMLFVVAAMIVFNQYPLTAIMIIILALLDDIPIMTIAEDNAPLDPKPVRWDMHRVLWISAVMGVLALFESFGMLLIGRYALHLPTRGLQTMMFLQLVAGGHLMLFLTRTRKYFWRKPHPSWQLFTAIVGTQVLAVIMSWQGWLVPPIGWEVIGIVWGYNIVWMFGQDFIKIHMYRWVKAARQPETRHPQEGAKAPAGGQYPKRR
jgi:H+-transporting ATPase